MGALGIGTALGLPSIGGPLPGMFGTAGGINGTGFNTTNPTDSGQMSSAYGGVQNSLGSQQQLLSALQGQGGIQNQNQVYGQLQNVAQGKGPNPALAQLNQTTAQNIAQQGAMQASQRGASANPALIARQAAQQGGQLQQQAAGQAATMNAQQQLAGIQAAGQMANAQATNQIGQTNANTGAQMGEQQQLFGANQGYNTQQAGLANTSMQGQQGVLGGVMNGIGAVMGAARGGAVKMANGGLMGGGLGSNAGAGSLASGLDFSAPAMQDQTAFQGPQSKFGQFLANSSPQQDVQMPNSGAAALKKGAGSLVSGLLGSAMAKGGQVQAMVSPGEKYLSPEKVEMVKRGANPTQVAETIPGKPKVGGAKNSYANDTVPKKLEEGGVVIPRSVTQGKNPVNESARFVAAVLAKKHKKAA